MKTKKTKKKNNKGFTLIELLAVIAILSIIMSITIYVSTNVASKAKQKSYEVTIANLEKNANTYVTENNDKIFYLSKDTNTEYQCVTVSNLIDMGYLDTKVVESKVSDNDKVNLNDYIYLERNKNTKAVQKSIYDNGSYGTICSNAINANGDIIFNISPDINKWSKEKQVTITYKLRNYQDYSKYNYQYTVYNASNNSIITNKTNATNPSNININKKVTINAKINSNGSSTPIVHKTITIDKIDTTKPVIELTEGINNGNYNGSVKIPISIIDTESKTDIKTIDKSDFNVSIVEKTPTGNVFSTQNIQPSALKLTKLEELEGEVKYELEITDNTNTGDIVIKVLPDAIYDNAGNGNIETTLTPQVSMNKIYELSNRNNVITGYCATLEKAFQKVPNPGNIKALADDENANTAINNNKDVMLNTNYHTIKLTKTITNSSTLDIKGYGKITTPVATSMFINNGTMLTSNVTIENTYDSVHNEYIIKNYGKYTANNSTNLYNIKGRGLYLNKGPEEVKLNGVNTIIESYHYTLHVPSNAADNNNIIISGATITNASGHGIIIGNDNYTTNLQIIGGNVISNNTLYHGIYVNAKGTTNINITGGTVKGSGNYGIFMNTTGNATLTVGSSGGAFNATSPKIIGSKYAIRADSNAKWYWYDGELYGNTSSGNYNTLATIIRTNYNPLTVTTSSGGYKSYLAPVSKITLNKNGATNTPTASVTVTYNSNTISPNSIIIPEKKYTVSGFGLDATRKSTGANVSSTASLTSTYTFNGWYTATNGGRKVLSNATSPVLQANVANYTVVNGIWKGTDATLYAQFTGVSVKLPTITKTGYTCGWTTSASGKTIVHASGANITPTANTTLYGVCYPNNYTITAHAPEGFSEETEGWERVDTYRAIKLIEYEKLIGNVPSIYYPSQYNYSWWTQETAGGKLIQGNMAYTFDYSIDIYPQFISKQFNITFNANGGTISSSSNWSGSGSTVTKTIDFSESYGALPTPTRAGYTFLGWYTTKSGGTKIENNTKLIYKSNHTIYAHWKSGTCHLAFYDMTKNTTEPIEEREVVSGATYGAFPDTNTSLPCIKNPGWYANINGIETQVDSNTICDSENNTDIKIEYKFALDCGNPCAANPQACACAQWPAACACLANPVGCMQANSEAYFGLVEAGDWDRIHYLHDVVQPALCNLASQCAGYASDGSGRWLDQNGNALFTIDSSALKDPSYGGSYAYIP